MPWYHDGCKACSDNPVRGIGSTGQPCRMCDVKNKKAGLPTSEAFEFDADGDGNYVWVDKETGKDGEVKVVGDVKSSERVSDEKPAPAEPEAAEPEAAEPEPEPEPKAAEPEAPDDSDADDSDDSDDGKPSKPRKSTKSVRRGRPPSGFSLYVNCIPAGRPVVTLEAIFDQLASELANEAKVDSFYAIDSFKRKDALSHLAGQLLERFAGHHVVARSASPGTDIGALLSALRSKVNPLNLVEGLQ
jgi:hypothetical protein